MGGKALLGAFTLVTSALGVTLAAPPAGALLIINVTSTADGGAGSLRDAFDSANTDGDDTEIRLQAGATYQLTDCAGGVDEDANVGGDLDHTEAGTVVTVTGNGATIEQTCADERVIDNTTPNSLNLHDLTITGGDSTGDGGGIQAGQASLSGVTLTGNHADGGGGGLSSPNSQIIDSVITGNTATEDGGGLELSGGGTVWSVTASTVAGNTAGASGGGIYGSGGGADGTITDSLISDNTSVDEGGGATISGGGVVATVTGTTFVDNVSSAGVGGGLQSSGGGGVLTLTNSTFTTNAARRGGGLAVGGDGGQTITHVTFADNEAGITGSQVTDAFGPNSPGFSNVTLFGTVLSGAGDGCDLTDPPTDAGYNYATDVSCEVGPANDSIADGADPELDPLDDNGGPTPTRIPHFGSPLVDAIPVADCNATVTVDQRGVARPEEDGCDIGAVEGEADEVIEPPVEPEPPVVEPIAGSPAFTG